MHIKTQKTTIVLLACMVSVISEVESIEHPIYTRNHASFLRPSLRVATLRTFRRLKLNRGAAGYRRQLKHTRIKYTKRYTGRNRRPIIKSRGLRQASRYVRRDTIRRYSTPQPYAYLERADIRREIVETIKCYSRLEANGERSIDVAVLPKLERLLIQLGKKLPRNDTGKAAPVDTCNDILNILWTLPVRNGRISMNREEMRSLLVSFIGLGNMCTWV
jgi:hypothetical protein